MRTEKGVKEEGNVYASEDLSGRSERYADVLEKIICVSSAAPQALKICQQTKLLSF